VAFDAPVVGQVARCVLNHTDANGSKLPSAPVGEAALAFMLSARDLRPVGGAERDSGHVHVTFLCYGSNAKHNRLAMKRSGIAGPR